MTEEKRPEETLLEQEMEQELIKASMRMEGKDPGVMDEVREAVAQVLNKYGLAEGNAGYILGVFQRGSGTVSCQSAIKNAGMIDVGFYIQALYEAHPDIKKAVKLAELMQQAELF